MYCNCNILSLSDENRVCPFCRFWDFSTDRMSRFISVYSMLHISKWPMKSCEIMSCDFHVYSFGVKAVNHAAYIPPCGGISSVSWSFFLNVSGSSALDSRITLWGKVSANVCFWQLFSSLLYIHNIFTTVIYR